MAENCTHDCSSCSSNCKSKDLRATLHDGSCVKKVIGVVSGKGGVGKSLVTALLAAKMRKSGFKTAVLDADITGPSIPTSFGVSEQKAMGDKNGTIYPVKSEKGVKLMSMNFLLEKETDPVLWRGPVIAGAVKQFWTDVDWGDIDFMFVDMPPGTGDVPLTVFQSLPIDGIVIVSSPQQLVRVIVEKAVKMAGMMKIPILGLVENMSYVKCPHCNEEIKVFGESNINGIALEYGIPVLAKIPMSEDISKAIDSGDVESLDGEFLDAAVKQIEMLNGKN
ncbi:MAG: Mrp/NBP35 family ATP-binding protein [Treponema sp.]|nr:Mrp/NBP35 family ATP-binding protein [Treponema sp.]